MRIIFVTIIGFLKILFSFNFSSVNEHLLIVSVVTLYKNNSFVNIVLPKKYFYI